jgi:hypothetical protein
MTGADTGPLLNVMLDSNTKTLWVYTVGRVFLTQSAEGKWDSAEAGTVQANVGHFEVTRDQAFISSTNSLPLALEFRTPKGLVGLLQILGFTENPRGVKIRYKLVQPPDTTRSR